MLPALMLWLTTGLFAQNDLAVLLHTGTAYFPANIGDFPQRATISKNETVEDRYYRLVQFNEMPDKATFKTLEAMGVKLLEYIPNKTYVASLPTLLDPAALVSTRIRSIQPIEPGLKMSAALRHADIPDWAREKEHVLVMLQFYKDLPHAHVLRYCEADGIEVLRSNGLNNFLRVRMPISRLQAIAALPYVAFMETIPPPDEPDDIIGRSLHRANVIDTDFPGGRQYTGKGVSVCVRDDGFVGPHIDFQGRIDNSFVEPQTGNHGDGVAGIMGGAGNLNPHNKGMAAGSFLYIINYESDFLDETMELHTDYGVLITNSSYSNGCNAGYTITAATVDQQLYDFPTLQHVFSAGNSNNSNCGYGAGNQWGNITGGHKQAKNCIATANLNGDGTLVNSSSRGPAHDGRLKPDIAAHGQGQISTSENNNYQVFGGTSAASPGIAGITAQLHQAHRELNGGETAEAALLKVLLLNTANDLGNPGPDFRFGWGHVNAYRAALALEEKRYFKNAVAPGEIVAHTVTIPENVLEARIMVYWADPEASVLTTQALVNDLDIWLTDDAGTEYLPWLLDPTPNTASLNAPATKGVDVLNNMEQVAIENPEPGEYTLHVSGKTMPFGDHPYWVTWEFRTAEITVTHPVGGEGFAPGDTVRIHWDAQGNVGDFELAYSTDGGASYVAFDNAPGDARMYDWSVPNKISGQVRIRVSRDGEAGKSDEVFSIAPRPENVHVVKVCPDYIRIAWDPVDISAGSDVTQYEVYLLGDQYMEPVALVSTNEADIPAIDGNTFLDHWFAVKTIGENGIRSERTIAVRFSGGLLECAQAIDASILTINSPSAGNIVTCGEDGLPVTVTVKNEGLEVVEDLPVSYVLDGGPPVTEAIPGILEPGATVIYTFSTLLDITASGEYTLEVFTDLPGDMYLLNDKQSQEMTLSVITGNGEPLDYLEGFDTGVFPPQNYIISNPDNAITWSTRNVTGPSGSQTRALFVDHYSYSQIGQEDALLVTPVNLEGAVNPYLRFDLAYTYYNNTWFDGLRIEISSDCGTSFSDVIYEKFKDDLATVSAMTGVFTPNNASQWRKEFIDLSAYIGSKIVLKFVAINGYGNSLYVDNVNVFNLFAPVAGFNASATTICENQQVLFTNTSSGELATYNWNFGQGATPPASTTSGSANVTYSTVGTSTVSLTVTNPAGVSTFTQDLVVEPMPKAAFTFEVDGGTVTFTNASQDAATYTWDFGDGSVSTDENPVYSFDASGTFTVKLVAVNNCGSDEFTLEVDVTVTGLSEFERRIGAVLLPNPNRGTFILNIQNDRTEMLRVDLLDVRGVLHQRKFAESMPGLTSLPFDAAHLSSGMYFVKIHGDTGVKVLKMVVE